MIASNKTTFCKSETCPSSNELLDLENGVLSSARAAEVDRHLETCEFCAAEADFYALYPQDETPADAPELTSIPAPLFQLAEALLKKKTYRPQLA